MKLKHFLLIFSLVSLTGIVHAQTVHYTKSGRKYHAAGCSYLSKTDFICTLAEARNKGLSRCSICSPPTKIEKPKGETKEPRQQQDPPQKSKQPGASLLLRLISSDQQAYLSSSQSLLIKSYNHES